MLIFSPFLANLFVLRNQFFQSFKSSRPLFLCDMSVDVQVTDFNEENDDGKKVSNEKLDSFLTGSREHKQEVKKINIRKEDVQLIVSFTLCFSHSVGIVFVFGIVSLAR